ncbi:hypothetical protein FB451DRAFT_1190212 [Mycena latifolia]|nr:hypothetical protein FB451DRAFT_1190212 [Mycena latifolia]
MADVCIYITPRRRGWKKRDDNGEPRNGGGKKSTAKPARLHPSPPDWTSASQGNSTHTRRTVRTSEEKTKCMARLERILVVQEMRGVGEPQDLGWRDSESIAVSGALGVGGLEAKETNSCFDGVDAIYAREKSCSASTVDVFAKSSPPIPSPWSSLLLAFSNILLFDDGDDESGREKSSAASLLPTAIFKPVRRAGIQDVATTFLLGFRCNHLEWRRPAQYSPPALHLLPVPVPRGRGRRLHIPYSAGPTVDTQTLNECLGTIVRAKEGCACPASLLLDILMPGRAGVGQRERMPAVHHAARPIRPSFPFHWIRFNVGPTDARAPERTGAAHEPPPARADHDSRACESGYADDRVIGRVCVRVGGGGVRVGGVRGDGGAYRQSPTNGVH